MISTTQKVRTRSPPTPDRAADPGLNFLPLKPVGPLPFRSICEPQFQRFRCLMLLGCYILPPFASSPSTSRQQHVSAAAEHRVGLGPGGPAEVSPARSRGVPAAAHGADGRVAERHPIRRLRPLAVVVDASGDATGQAVQRLLHGGASVAGSHDAHKMLMPFFFF